jgi:hypothetical protein
VECYEIYKSLGNHFPKFLEFFGMDKLEHVDCFILQTVADSEKKNSWVGLTRTMGADLKSQNKNVVSEMKHQV